MHRASRPIVGLAITAAALLGLAGAVGVGGGCGPLPGERHEAAAPPPDIVTVHTGDGRYFYLVDTRREMCFFGDRYRPQLTKVPCEEVPEAWDLLGWEATEAVPPNDAEVETGEDEPIPPLSPPGQDNGAGDEVSPPPDESVDPGPPPTAEEKQSFEKAFVERFCASRRPSDEDTGPPDAAAIAERHGLTPERYEQVREHLSRDAAAWRALSESALKACP